MTVTRIFLSAALAVAFSGPWLRGQEEGASDEALQIPRVAPERVAAAGFFGVSGEEVSAGELEKMKIPGGVRLTDVGEDSPADRAGFIVGDIIFGVDEAVTGTMLQLRKAVTDRRPGDIVTFDVLRKGQRQRKRATLNVRPALPLVVIPPDAVEPRVPKVAPNGIQRFQRFGLGEDGQRFKMRDNDGTVEVVGPLDAREATVWDMSNKIIFEGPWVTPQDKAVPPEKTRKRIERVEKTFALRLQRPQPFVVPQRRFNPAPGVPAVPPRQENQPKPRNPQENPGK